MPSRRISYCPMRLRLFALLSFFEFLSVGPLGGCSCCYSFIIHAIMKFGTLHSPASMDLCILYMLA